MPTPNQRPIRIAVVGAGLITQAVHLPALQLLAPRFDLATVCDLSIERAAAVAAGVGDAVRAAGRYADVLEDDSIEAVLLATSGTQAAQAAAALVAGKHVLAEKPLCLTRAEADDLERTATSRQRVLQVGYMKMYDPAVSAARHELDRLGEPTLIRITVLHPATAPQVAHVPVVPAGEIDRSALHAAQAHERDRTRDAVGDVPAEIGAYYRDILQGSVIHELSVLRGLGVPLPDRFDDADVWPWPVTGELPSLLARATIGERTRLVLSWNWLPDYPAYREEVAVFSRNGCVRVDLAVPYRVDSRSTVHVERGGHGPAAPDGDHDDERTSPNGYLAQLEAFAASVRDGAPVIADTAGAAADTRCLQSLLVAVADAVGVTVGGEAAAAIV
ncbi:MAG: Gfo/Idh/MocA family protein [Acidimicrobiales bacterium]